MKRLISARLAGNILLVAFALLAIFHVLVLLGWVPSDIVWGGQVGGSPTSLLALETISLVVTLVFMLVVAAKMGYARASGFKIVIDILVWIIFAYMLLNTLGNLASAVSVEQLFFAPISLLAAFLALRLAIEK